MQIINPLKLLTIVLLVAWVTPLAVSEPEPYDPVSFSKFFKALFQRSFPGPADSNPESPWSEQEMYNRNRNTNLGIHPYNNRVNLPAPTPLADINLIPRSSDARARVESQSMVNLGENNLYGDPASSGFQKMLAQPADRKFLGKKLAAQRKLNYQYLAEHEDSLFAPENLVELELETPCRDKALSSLELAESETGANSEAKAKVHNTKTKALKFLTRIKNRLRDLAKKKGHKKRTFSGKAIIAKNGEIQRTNNTILNYENAQYVIQMGVGAKEKRFKFILDTGSTTLLLITDKCKSDGCNEHQSYHAGKKAQQLEVKTLTQSSAVNAISSLHVHKISYAQGFVKYQTLIDNFWIGNLEITAQTFGGVVKEKSVFENADYDGLVGFSYKALGVPPGIMPIFNNVIKQGNLKKNVFSLFISRKGHKSSRFWLGGVNLQYIKNADPKQITWHNVVKKTWWTLKLDKVYIGKKDTGLCSPTYTQKTNSNCAIIMDSGTSSMAAPSQTFHKFQKMLNKAGSMNSVKSWPDLTFVIDGKNYVMPGYTYLLVNGMITYQEKSGPFDIVQPSFGSFDSGDLDFAVWIAGDAFLSQFMTIYDRDKNRVGLVDPWLSNIDRVQSKEISKMTKTVEKKAKIVEKKAKTVEKKAKK